MTRLNLGHGVAAVVFLLVTAVPVSAHPVLERASPAAGAILDSAPGEIRLTFSVPVNASLSRIVLEGPSGAVSLGDLYSPADSAQILLIPVAGSMTDGGYTVHWTVVGDDGHPVNGEYGFAVGAGRRMASRERPEATLSEMDPDTASRAPGAAAPGTGISDQGDPDTGGASREGGRQAGDTGSARVSFEVGSPVYVLVRWVNFGGILAGLGALSFVLLVLPSATRRGANGVDGNLEGLAARVGVAAAGIVLLGGVARLLAQRAAMFGPEATLALTSGTGSLLSTRWGVGWGLQMVGGLLALWGFSRGTREGRWRWGTAVGGILLLSVTPALSGHASSADVPPILPIVADTLHVVGGGGWMGGLLLLVLATLKVRRESEDPAATVRQLVHAFSPTALTFAGLLALTGVYGAVIHLHRVGDLWATEWGRALLLKIFLVVLVLVMGAYNAYRVRPALGSGETGRRLWRTAGLELAMGSGVLLATAVLVATPSPAAGSGDPRAGTVAEADPGPSGGESGKTEEQVLEAVRAFHEALRDGNRVRAIGLLADDAVVLEGGSLETREEYLSHHLDADMAFAAEVDRTTESRTAQAVGDVAWVASTSRTTGSFGERSIDSRGVELVVLGRTRDGWRIHAIHWSSMR